MAGVCGLSTVDVMKVARSRFAEFSSQQKIDLSMLNQFYSNSHFGLSGEEIKNVELAHLLLDSVEKVSNQQFDCAREVLNLCDFLSSSTGNSVQRVIRCFTKALRGKIDRETRRITSNGLETKGRQLLDPGERLVSLNPAIIACTLRLPFIQVAQFVGVQAIIESVALAKKVHLIDLSIRSGAHCTALMQAFATRHEFPLELLKVTAVGTTLKQKIEKTGERLACFAETLNIPFSFKIAMVEDIKYINEDMFELNDGEVVAILSQNMLRHLQIACFESLMRVLQKLNPCVMVIVEIEADHISPMFIDRFFEALYFYSACFDCLEVCMDRCDPDRMTLEAIFLCQEIHEIVAAEDEERIFRHMKIEDWRASFTRFGMMESELSMSSWCQADLVAKNFACGSACTIYRNGKSLISGWKGTPILSLSAWKFHQENV